MTDSDLWVDVPQDELIVEINAALDLRPEPSREDGWVSVRELAKNANMSIKHYNSRMETVMAKEGCEIEKTVWKCCSYYRKVKAE